MKRYLINPHLMLMGFLTLIVVSSGTSVKAQEEKRITQSIMIKNGDTIINGKKLSEADLKEKARLRAEFKNMESRLKGSGGQNEERAIVRRKNGKDNEIIINHKGDAPHVLHWNDGNMREFEFDLEDKMPGGMHVFKFKGDSIAFDFNTDSMMKEFRFKIDGLDSNIRKRVIAMHRNMAPMTPRMPRMPIAPMPPMPPMVFEKGEFSGAGNRNSSSSFNYNHVDKDGIPSRMSIRISDAEKEKLKAITGSENTSVDLDVKDLTLFPNFSNGKAGLSFNLDGRGTTKIKILNSDLKAVFTDEVTSFQGNYMKQISLPQNGVYYITIGQNSKWFVKKLIKN
ncbi:MAG: hypothetical protein WC220_06675 [Pedobacter sp.]|jgi:hypothetical protein